MDYEPDFVVMDQENNGVAAYQMCRNGVDKGPGRVVEALVQQNGGGTTWQGL